MQHKEICDFPSEEFYEKRLQTAVDQPMSILCVNNKPKPVVFGHIEGAAVSLMVNTAKGNENSKANRAEQDIVVLYSNTLCFCVGLLWGNTLNFKDILIFLLF